MAPIFVAVQAWSSEDRRARVVGAVNTLNSIYMVVGSLFTTLLLKLTGIDESTALWLPGFANVAAAIYLFRRLPVDFRASVLGAGNRLRAWIGRLSPVGASRK